MTSQPNATEELKAFISTRDKEGAKPSSEKNWIGNMEPTRLSMRMPKRIKLHQ